MSSHKRMGFFYLLTFIEGVFFATMVATSESYVLYYFTKKGLSDFDIALLSTIPIFISAITQLIFPRFIKDSKIKQAMIGAYSLQLVGLLGFMYCALSPENYHLIFLLLSLTCYWTGGQNSGLFWIDWISKFVPEKKFGDYISKRNVIVVTTTLVIYLLISLGLTNLQHFYYIFIGGFAARTVSVILQLYLFRLSRDDNSKNSSTNHLGDLSDASNTGDNRDSGKENELDKKTKKILLTFFLWTGLFKFSAHISSCFFVPYMINYLKLPLVSYVVLTGIPYLGRALFLQNWARASAGGKRSFWGIQVSCVMIATFPALWTCSDNYAFLMFLQILSGVFWGGHELSCVLMIQSVSYANARKWMGLHQAFLTFCAVNGALIGGVLLKYNYDYHFVFNLSSFLRFVCAVGFLYHIRRYRDVAINWRKSRIFLYAVLSLRPSLASIGRIILPPFKLKKKQKSPLSF